MRKIIMPLPRRWARPLSSGILSFELIFVTVLFSFLTTLTVYPSSSWTCSQEEISSMSWSSFHYYVYTWRGEDHEFNSCFIGITLVIFSPLVLTTPLNESSLAWLIMFTSWDAVNSWISTNHSSVPREEESYENMSKGSNFRIIAILTSSGTLGTTIQDEIVWHDIHISLSFSITISS